MERNKGAAAVITVAMAISYYIRIEEVTELASQTGYLLMRHLCQ